MLYSVLTSADKKWERLAEFASSMKLQFGRRVFVLDFDGTVAPIVDLPSDAAVDPTMVVVMQRLIEVSDLVILSGRTLEFLRGRLSFLHNESAQGNVRLYGHYGLVSSTLDGSNFETESLDPTELKELYELKQRWLANPVSEIFFEDKGYSCAFHYRNAVGYKDQLLDWIADNVTTKCLVPRPGKMVVEVLPTSSPSKVSVIRSLSRKYDSIVFAGDDLGDLDAFAEIERERDLGLSRFSVLVEGGFETPPELLVSCDFKVESPTKLALLLDRIRDSLQTENPTQS